MKLEIKVPFAVFRCTSVWNGIFDFLFELKQRFHYISWRNWLPNAHFTLQYYIESVTISAMAYEVVILVHFHAAKTLDNLLNLQRLQFQLLEEPSVLKVFIEYFELACTPTIVFFV